MNGSVTPPWTVALTSGEHDLILLGLVATALALLATLVRVRFAPQDSFGGFRAGSLTANAVVALALASYVGLIMAFLFGYEASGDGYVPNDLARLAWAIRFMDWIVTVPLLVLELIAVSALSDRAISRIRPVGMVTAVVMIGCGFIGAFVVADGRDLMAYTLFGIGGAVCFVVLYALFFGALRTSLPRMPEAARRPYRSAVVLLLITWLLYPVVYGFLGVLAGGAVVVASQLLLSTADMVAKIGFGTLIHRPAVIRSRVEEALDPGDVRRPRAPESDSVYVADRSPVDFRD